MKKLYLIIIISLLIFTFACNPENKTIKYSIEPEGAGYVEETTHDNGIITVGAYANDGYSFDYWSEGLDGYVNHCPKNHIEGNKVTAHFKEYAPQPIVNDDFETGDFSKNPYSLGGDTEPFIQDSDTYEGTYAVRFGDINDSQSSFFTLEDITINSETIVSFYVMVDSETSSWGVYDGFSFYVDGSQIIEWDEDDCGSWTQYQYILSEGMHTLKWEYAKDSIYSGGEDTAWVDNIEFDGDVTIEPPKPEISISGVENGDIVDRKVLADEATEIIYKVQNVGKATLYVDNVIIDSSNFTISQQPESEVAPGESTQFVLSVTVSDGQIKSTGIMLPNSDDDESPFIFDLNVEGVNAQPGWLFMMYMDGDNNLDSLLWGDVNEMEYGLHQLQQNGVDISNIHFLVLWDGYGSGDSALYELGPDSVEDTNMGPNTIDLTSEKWWSGDEVNVGDGTNVTEFLNWAETRYTGFMNRMLLFSNHGGGPGKGDIPDRGVCWDDTNGHDYLSTKEVRESIENAGFNANNKLSIIGFDVCMQGNIEEAYEHRNVSNYMVASPESEQGDGWEFNDWIPRMTSDMEDPESLVTHIVQSYRDNFGSDQTLTATNLNEMDNLKSAIDDLASAIMADSKQSAAQSIMSSAHSYSYSYLHEFGIFCMGLENSSNMTSNIQTKATTAKDALGNAVVYAWAGPSGGNYDGEGSVVKRGLSISAQTNLSPGGAYSDLQFSIGSDGWDELISLW